MIRCFVAIFPPRSLCGEIVAIQNRLSHKNADIKWVEAHNLHFTLHFLGDVKKEHIFNISKVLKDCASDFTRFSLGLKGIGAFPHLKNPRVLGVGVGKGRRQLENLMATIGENMKLEGYPSDNKKPLSHLTIGRIRSIRGSNPFPCLIGNDFEIKGER